MNTTEWLEKRELRDLGFRVAEVLMEKLFGEGWFNTIFQIGLGDGRENLT